MRTGERFSAVLQDELGCRAVWPPVLTPIKLGDYGVLDGGVFQKLGHVSDFGVEIEVEQGAPSSLNFLSASAAVHRLAGDVPVDSFGGLAGVHARLMVEFSESSSFMLKCRKISVEQIANIAAIGRELGRARSDDGRSWSSLSWRIVWQLYTGRDVVFLATRSAGTTVDFSGKVEAIQQLDAGGYSAGVRVQPSRSLGVEIVGRTGPVGLNLAKVKLFTSSIGFLSDSGEPEPEASVDLKPDDPAAVFAGQDDSPAEAPTLALSFSLDQDVPEADEPETERARWEDLDLEATDPADVSPGALSFVDDAPVDTASPERWLQSCLRRLADPELVVDGKLGVRTRLALKLFQRQVGLSPDGLSGPQTQAALESRTGVPCPAPPPASVTDAEASATLSDADASTPPADPTHTASATLQLRELPAAGARASRAYAVRDGDDEVRFSYWSDPHGDDLNVSAYEGARTGLVTDADLQALGARPGAIRILRANAMKESGGKFGAVNTWDDQLVSWGVAQFAGRAGTLAALLASLRETSPDAYQRRFADHGLDVDYGPYPSRKRGSEGPEQRKGWHAVVVDEGGKRRAGDDAWAHLRGQPRLIGALMLAGNDKAIQLGQCRFWLEHFLDRAIHKVVVRTPRGDRRVGDYLTTEYALGLVVRLHNWMPAYVATWFGEFLTELGARRRDLDLTDPAIWRATPAVEVEFGELLKAKRRAVKKGSYDTYGLDLSRVPGSFLV